MAFFIGVWVGAIAMTLIFMLVMSTKDREKQKPTDG